MAHELSPEMQEALSSARKASLRAGIDRIEVRDLIFGMLEVSNCWATRFMRRAGIDLEGLRAYVQRETADADARPATNRDGGDDDPDQEMRYSPACENLLETAGDGNRDSSGVGFVDSRGVMRVILFDDDYYWLRLWLEAYGLDFRRVEVGLELMELIPQADAPVDQGHFMEFATYATPMPGRAGDSGWGPAVGRDNEVRWAAKTLGRIVCNNVVFVGEPGVGKTAAAHGLARYIVDAPTGDPLRDKRVIGINVPEMRKGTSYRDDFVSRLTEVLKTASRSNGRIILFVGSIRDFFDANSGWASPNGVTAALVPLLVEGSLQIVGTATPAEFKKLISDDPVLRKHFAAIPVEAPDIEAAIEMLKAVRPRLERRYKVKISDEAIRVAVELSVKVMPNQNLPAKAVDLIDEAAALKRPDASTVSSEAPVVTAEDIRALIARRADKPVAHFGNGDGLDVDNLKEQLRRHVTGQDPALECICEAIWRALHGLNRPNAPIGVFLFLGPSGVGKTASAKALAIELFGDVINLIRIDMSEITERADVSRLIGGSPNYVGYREGGQLTNAVRENPRSVILLDEIEKAHPKAFDLLLQVFEEGQLTDGQGRKVGFSQTIIIMTSNLGSNGLVDLSALFAPSDSSERKLPSHYENAIKRTFKPEFVNRIDDIVVFQPLYREALLVVIENELDALRRRLADKGISIEVNNAARDWLLELPRDTLEGARPILRAFDRHVVTAIAKLIASGQAAKDATVIVDAVNGQLTFSAERRDLAA